MIPKKISACFTINPIWYFLFRRSNYKVYIKNIVLNISQCCLQNIEEPFRQHINSQISPSQQRLLFSYSLSRISLLLKNCQIDLRRQCASLQYRSTYSALYFEEKACCIQALQQFRVPKKRVRDLRPTDSFSRREKPKSVKTRWPRLGLNMMFDGLMSICTICSACSSSNCRQRSSAPFPPTPDGQASAGRHYSIANSTQFWEISRSKPMLEPSLGPTPSPLAIFRKQNSFRALAKASAGPPSRNEKHLTASLFGVRKTVVSRQFDLEAKLWEGLTRYWTKTQTMKLKGPREAFKATNRWLGLLQKTQILRVSSSK